VNPKKHPIILSVIEPNEIHNSAPIVPIVNVIILDSAEKHIYYNNIYYELF
jgi:hypothetical protein